MREVERYQLDLVGLTPMHSLSSGTILLDRGWTLFFSGVAQNMRRGAGVGILMNPRLSSVVVGRGENADGRLCVCTERQFRVL